MKNYFLFTLLFICLGFVANAQEKDTTGYDTIPPCEKNRAIPSFELIKPDSTWFTSKSLPKGKSLLIVYFNSQCAHCKLEAKELVSLRKKIKNSSVVMVSYHDTPEEIGQFAKENGLYKISNVIIGRDPVYNLPAFFKVRLTPFLAVYGKSGLLKKTYQGDADIDELIGLLNE